MYIVPNCLAIIERNTETKHFKPKNSSDALLSRETKEEK